MPLNEPNVLPFVLRSERVIAERDEDELMAASKLGARDAFAEIVHRLSPMLVQYCARMVGDRRAAEEIAQETWIAIWRARDRYVPQGRFKVFLYQAARNRCLNHKRGRRRRDRWELPELEVEGKAESNENDSGFERYVQLERQRRMHSALATLGDHQREAVILRCSEELSYDEMAVILGENESTLRSRVFYGLKALKAALGKEAPP